MSLTAWIALPFADYGHLICMNEIFSDYFDLLKNSFLVEDEELKVLIFVMRCHEIWFGATMENLNAKEWIDSAPNPSINEESEDFENEEVEKERRASEGATTHANDCCDDRRNLGGMVALTMSSLKGIWTKKRKSGAEFGDRTSGRRAPTRGSASLDLTNRVRLGDASFSTQFRPRIVYSESAKR